MSLCGTGETHCCWLGKAGECPHVEKSTEDGFNWRCGLRAKSADWAAVYVLAEYQQDVKPHLAAMGYPDTDCGSWPPENITCNDCGEVGK